MLGVIYDSFVCYMIKYLTHFDYNSVICLLKDIRALARDG